ncbi:MAG: protein NO VEIN domain-containing protein [Nitrosotalea sp.]
MLTDLREINRLIIVVGQMAINGKAKRKDVVEQCKNIVLGGHIPDHDATIKFCIDMSIIEESNGILSLSPFGNHLLRLNHDNNYDLNKEQEHVLITQCFFRGYFLAKTIDVLKQLIPDNKLQTFVFSSDDESQIQCEPPFLALLKQISLIQERDQTLVLNPAYAEHASILLSTRRKMTLEELEEKLELDKIIGRIAEQVVLRYEKQRLSENNAPVESELVQIISNTNVDAGYDMESFDGKTLDLQYDRFIEVKGSTQKETDFFWSANEIDVANQKKAKYWIYFVSGINVNLGTANENIEMIPNPVLEVFEGTKFNHKCVKFHVWKNSSNLQENKS